MPTTVHAACPLDCPDACGVLVTIDDGAEGAGSSRRAVKLQGDPAHPVTRGFLCGKVAKYLDLVYSPERVLYPMKRIAPKGPTGEGISQGSAHGSTQGSTSKVSSASAPNRSRFSRDLAAFERISWDEALDTIASRLKSVAAEFGPEAILPYSYSGTLGKINNGAMDHRFFHRLGASQLARNICAAAGVAGLTSVYGNRVGTEPEQYAHSKYIIAWASNIHGNNIHLWPFVEEARRNGAKLVVIDPYETRTAKLADWHLPIRPGTDVALALGLMHVIIGEGLHDADYVARYTVGFDELKQTVADFPLAKVAEITGIAAEDILKLAREYATTQPAAIRLNYGIQRSENGGTAVRTVAMLPCLIGAWRWVGGGLTLSTSGSFPLRLDRLAMKELMHATLGREARTINMVELGQALTKERSAENDPPVKALFVYASNPAAVAPNHNDVIRGMMRPDLFTVVHEQFLTDTTDYADIVLPATSWLEQKDLVTAYGHYYLQVSQQAIAPLGEAKSNHDLFAVLAERMGFDESCFRASVDDLIDEAVTTDDPWMRGIDRARLEREGHVRLNLSGSLDRNGEARPFLPFAEGNFFTTSGKAQFADPELAAKGLNPVAEFIPPVESRQGQGATRFPLELLARKSDNYMNSSFCNLPGHQKMEERGLLELHPTDASHRSIADGDSVRVFNQRGDLRLTARISEKVAPGVVAARLNWAKFSADGQNINVLTSEKLTDLGNSATFYSVLVEVQPAPE